MGLHSKVEVVMVNKYSKFELNIFDLKIKQIRLNYIPTCKVFLKVAPSRKKYDVRMCTGRR